MNEPKLDPESAEHQSMRSVHETELMHTSEKRRDAKGTFGFELALQVVLALAFFAAIAYFFK